MNFYQGLLFLNGYILDPRQADDNAPHYSTGYGNRAAAERTFRKLGNKRGNAPTFKTVAPPPITQTADCCG